MKMMLRIGWGEEGDAYTDSVPVGAPVTDRQKDISVHEEEDEEEEPSKLTGLLWSVFKAVCPLAEFGHCVTTSIVFFDNSESAFGKKKKKKAQQKAQ